MVTADKAFLGRWQQWYGLFGNLVKMLVFRFVLNRAGYDFRISECVNTKLESKSNYHLFKKKILNFYPLTLLLTPTNLWCVGAN